MDNPWGIHGLSMDYPWIIDGLSMDNPWTPRNRSAMLGEPASTFRGNRSGGKH